MTGFKNGVAAATISTMILLISLGSTPHSARAQWASGTISYTNYTPSTKTYGGSYTQSSTSFGIQASATYYDDAPPAFPDAEGTEACYFATTGEMPVTLTGDPEDNLLTISYELHINGSASNPNETCEVASVGWSSSSCTASENSCSMDSGPGTESDSTANYPSTSEHYGTTSADGVDSIVDSGSATSWTLFTDLAANAVAGNSAWSGDPNSGTEEIYGSNGSTASSYAASELTPVTID